MHLRAIFTGESFTLPNDDARVAILQALAVEGLAVKTSEGDAVTSWVLADAAQEILQPCHRLNAPSSPFDVRKDTKVLDMTLFELVTHLQNQHWELQVWPYKGKLDPINVGSCSPIFFHPR